MVKGSCKCVDLSFFNVGCHTKRDLVIWPTFFANYLVRAAGITFFVYLRVTNSVALDGVSKDRLVTVDSKDLFILIRCGEPLSVLVPAASAIDVQTPVSLA